MAEEITLNVQVEVLSMGVTDEEAAQLRKAGWKMGFGAWKSCRICHQQVAPWGFCWFSPGYVAYHKRCVRQSPLAQRGMKS